MKGLWYSLSTGINNVLTINQFYFMFWAILLASFNGWTAEQDPVVLEDMDVKGDNVSIERFEYPPLSAQLFLREEIEQRRIRAVQDLVDDVPNFHVSSAGSLGINNIISIRGLTNTLVFGSAPVSVYVDDVPFGDPVTFANRLYGIESIEVFRGPQSTLFGKNSYGGAFNVTSRRPGEEWEGDLSVEGGNFDYLAVNGYISGPIVQNQLAFSLAGAYSKRDGFLENTFLNNRPDHQEYSGGRGSLVWTPSNAWEISLSGSVDNFDDGAIQVVPLDGEPFTVQSNVSGKTKQFIDTEALRIHYLAQAFEVLSITARRNWTHLSLIWISHRRRLLKMKLART
jgi:iron complex outermembrane recepter protein